MSVPVADPPEMVNSAFLESLSALAGHSFATTTEAIERTLELVVQQLGLHSSYFTHITAEENLLHILKAYNVPNGCDIPSDVVLPLSETFCSVVFQTRAPVLMSDVTTDDVFATHAARFANPDIASYIAVPIILADDVWYGTLCAVDPMAQRLSQQQADLLVVLARLLATQIEYDQQRVAQESVAQTLREQAALLDLAHAAILVRDVRTSQITFWSRGAEALYGWTKAEALGRISHTVLQPTYPSPLAEIDAALVRDGYWEGELEHCRADGVRMVVASQWAMQRAGDGTPVAILEINADITERKRGEQRLAAQNGLTRVLAEGACLAEGGQHILEVLCVNLELAVGEIWTMDAEAGVLRHSTAWVAQKVDAAAFVAEGRALTLRRGEGLPGVIAASGAPQWIDNLALDAGSLRKESAAAAGLRSAFGFPVCVEGETVAVLVFFHTAEQPPDAALLALLTTFGSQIGQFVVRTEAEQALRESEERYRRLVEMSPDAVAVHADGRFVYVNPAGVALMGGREAADIVGRPIFDFVHPDSLALVQGRVETLVEGNAVSLVQERLVRLDGQPVDVETVGIPVTFGGRAAVQLVVRDIRLRKEAEDALRESEAALRMLSTIETAQNVGFAEKMRALLYLGCQRFGLTHGVLAAQTDGEWRVREAHPPVPAFPNEMARALAVTHWPTTAVATAPVELASGTTDSAYATYVGTAVWVEGQVYGTLSFFSATPRTRGFTNAEMVFLDMMAQWVGGEIERDQRMRELTLMREMGDMLQSCVTAEEAYSVMAEAIPRLFPMGVGAVYVVNHSRTLVEAVAEWGDHATEQRVFTPQGCWAMRRGRLHVSGGTRMSMHCPHAPKAMALCVPMIAQGATLGILHLRVGRQGGVISEAQQQLAAALAEHIGLALANVRLRESLQFQSVRDSLTGLYNRRYMVDALDREISQAARGSETLGVMMLDLDNFKRFNDSFGHAAGDAVLREMGALLQAHIRLGDTACRYGGEEIVLMLPGVTAAVLEERAEEVRAAVRGLAVAYQGQMLGKVSVSVGVALYPQHGVTGDAVVRAADAALYRAKALGRDRVVVAG